MKLNRLLMSLIEVFLKITPRLAFKSMGVTLMRRYISAEKFLGKRPYAIDVEIDYLITDDSEVDFDYFERREDVTVKRYEESWTDKFVPIIIVGVMLSILVLALVGLVAIIKALL
jgi:hypothetical protein